MENRTDPDVVQDIVPGDSLFTFIPQDVRMKKGPANADPFKYMSANIYPDYYL